MSDNSRFDILSEAVGHEVIVAIITRETYRGRLVSITENSIQLSGVIGSDINANITVRVDNMSIRKSLIRCVLFYEDFNTQPRANGVARSTNGVDGPNAPATEEVQTEEPGNPRENNEAPLADEEPKDGDAATPNDGSNQKENGEDARETTEDKNDAEEVKAAASNNNND